MTAKTLIHLLASKNLSQNASYRLFKDFFDERLEHAEAKALLLLLARKGETSAEVAGCLKALRTLEPPAPVRIPGLLDTCGTGGDNSQTINVSTLAAFVIAGAGGKVAKHGNRALSSKCGSSDLVEALGVSLNAGLEQMTESIRQAGIGYFHAPLFHPIFSRVQGLRKELKVRTLFNLLGPLANPLEVEAQMIGVSKPRHVRLFAEALRLHGLRRALVCHSQDGLDEISLSAPTRLAWVCGKKIRYETFHPKQLGLRLVPASKMKGGDLDRNRAAAIAILKGEELGPKRTLICVNAAAGLILAGLAKTMPEAFRQAQETLDSGKAYQALLDLIRLSQVELQHDPQ